MNKAAWWWAVRVSFFLYTAHVYSVIPYIGVYRLGAKECIVVYDLHADYADAALSKKQLSALVSLGKKRNATFIVEDMFDYNSSNSGIQASISTLYEDIQKGFVLFKGIDIIQYSGMFGLAQYCLKHAIPVVNVEFRHAYVLHSLLLSQGKKHEATQAFMLLYKSFRAVAQEIEYYNDDEQLASYYHDISIKVRESLDYLANNASKRLLSSDEKKAFFHHYWICMTLLLNARIAHQWYVMQAQRDDLIIIYVGGEHAQAAESVLVSRGYKKVTEHGCKDIVEYSKWYMAAFHDLEVVARSLHLWRLAINAAKRHRMRKSFIHMLRLAIAQAPDINRIRLKG